MKETSEDEDLISMHMAIMEADEGGTLAVCVCLPSSWEGEAGG